MNTKMIWTSILAIVATVATVGAVAEDAPKMKMTTDIPESIITPDSVETRIGTLGFFDGYPDDATTQLVYDNLDFMRGVEAFLNGIPATSIEAIRLGCVEVGAKRASDVVIFDKLMDSAPLFLTGNTDTVYALSLLELDPDAPTVVERTAVGELTGYLERITGAEFEIAGEPGGTESTVPGIYVGDTVAARRAGIDASGSEGCCSTSIV
mgnify:CR=1 FL=1